jgi:RimJ/RimL family protein N-acetyltransferase
MIESKRLYLRELKMEDIPSLFKVLGDAENMKYYPYTFDMPLVEKYK